MDVMPSLVRKTNNVFLDFHQKLLGQAKTAGNRFKVNL